LEASKRFFDARKAEAEKLVYKPSFKILDM
jgi:hypothetical protein